MNVNYREFLESKTLNDIPSGFQPGAVNDMLFDFQADIVRWAIKRGRAAIFADCGLGKTPMQLDWARAVLEETNKSILIVAPLAVSRQTKREGIKFGIGVNVCRGQEHVRKGINITNYEMLHKFDPDKFSGVVLDESSILKSFSGKVKNQIQQMFLRTPFKLFCTATPAPNDYLEIGNHAQLLNVMPSNEMIARWFINDTRHFGNYRLKHYAVDSFWEWVSSWAVCLRLPSDLGYSDKDFILPELKISKEVIPVDPTIKSDGMLFRLPSMNATSMHSELRLTAHDRAARVAEIVNSSDEQFLVWCHTNYEADELKKVISGAIEVRGSDSDEKKEERLFGFINNDFRVLITKPKIAGFGLNLQGCHNVVYVGMSYSYESFYQSVRRCWRFGQEYPVNVSLVMAETEESLYKTVMEKQEKHKEMQENMYKNADLNKGIKKDKALTIDYDHKVESGGSFEMHLGDSCELMTEIKDDEIDFSVFSPPFSNLYIYSDSIRDMGNSVDDAEFFEHFNFLIEELYRVTRPGRLCAVHCKNLVYYKGQRGTAGLRDFRGEIIRSFIDRGWDYHSEITIWKDPVTEMQRTKAHGLLHKQLCKDSTFSRQGLPDYLVIFRKWADDPEDELISPVTKNNLIRFDDYRGLKGPENVRDDRHYSIQVWQRYASPVWFDINQMDVLNKSIARVDKDEKHICPLQLDVIERAIHLWTNPGDTVFSPFAGIGSEGYGALKLGRKFKGIELKESYFNEAVLNLKTAESEFNSGKLF